jgi:hypothetical protein
MTTNERIEEQSFCYDPDFPPDVAAGLPLASAAAKPAERPSASVRRALRACGNAATTLARRRSSDS